MRLLEIIETTQNRHKKILEKSKQNLDLLISQEFEIDRKIQYLNNKFNIKNTYEDYNRKD